MNPTVPKSGSGDHVFMSGALTTLDPVSDKDFGIHTDQPYLMRDVEVYCWQEETVNEGEVTKYTYKSVWSSHYINSSGFRNKNYNNTKPAYTSDSFCASQVTMGTYKVEVNALAGLLSKTQYKPKGIHYIYSAGCNQSQPTIGDTRTSYKILSALSSNIKGVVSVRGKLRNNDTLVAQ